MDIRDHYLAVWNESDQTARSALLDASWHPSASYVDPLVEVVGTESISAVISAVHEQYPGFVFSPVGEVDVHHDVARFQWGLGMAGEEPVVVGFDVLSMTRDGRVETVTGFIDKMPA